MALTAKLEPLEGEGRNRTGIYCFADRSLTTRPHRHVYATGGNRTRDLQFFRLALYRTELQQLAIVPVRVELTTASVSRRNSTTEI